MKKLLATAAVAVLAFGPLACNKSNEGGSPSGGNNTVGTDANAFTLSTGPGGATHLKPNEEKSITIDVNRGSQFTQTVSLKADSQDKDIKVELTKSTAEATDKQITLKIKAEKDAAPGDHIVKVVGTPKDGKPANLEVKVTIDKP